MALSSISTHKLACILAPIDIPQTAESKQSQIAASEVSDTAICAQEKRIVHKIYFVHSFNLRKSLFHAGYEGYRFNMTGLGKHIYRLDFFCFIPQLFQYLNIPG